MGHIHILGICGTFMGSLAVLAKQLGYRVTGSDQHVYPPMSTQLAAAGIELIEGYDIAQLDLNPDIVVVGNVISRGNPVMEAVLNRMIPYTSGPAWLSEHVLKNRWVLAVAGTHGKTTTASLLTWILEYSHYSPGFLIGGVPNNFPASASLGASSFFVIEADEYDCAFFDKRSKFLHYHPRTTILNNLEYDHADIFPDLAAIQRQFHHLVRIIPGEGLIIYPAQDEAIKQVLAQGVWTAQQTIGDAGDWQAKLIAEDGSEFAVYFERTLVGQVRWSLLGAHNVHNALAAMAAARHVGVEPHTSCAALNEFLGVKRRMELVGDINARKIYDDFAHHPTAIATTLKGLRAKVGSERIIAVIEPRSNTMKQGVHASALGQSCQAADEVIWLEPQGLNWSLREVAKNAGNKQRAFCSVDEIIDYLVRESLPLDHIVIMSNGGFAGLHTRLMEALDDA
ncbi:MAG: UDP-N-acetylmuramate:L-alanyl-gamma-D-glutamyl-meso-diaminopimelate ligase [Moraxellaceae bacterium]|nr:MAG: UDP-N-acetylmuramate:L-alanyl-gamma-D-glutamyl-meso-diaminopimelate ligase [Moraxellaceae bacterium]